MSSESGASPYRYVANLHEAMGQLYSGGRIRACKEEQAKGLRAGERVLCAGGGAGEDACITAARGCLVTLVDHSPEMIALTQAALDRRGQRGVELCCEDIRAHHRLATYDAVCANFFLRDFPEPELPGLIDHLVAQLRPGGRLLIADFALAGGVVERCLQHAYHAIPMALYALAARTPVQGLFDLEPHLMRAGLRVAERGIHRVYRTLPLFQTLTAFKS